MASTVQTGHMKVLVPIDGSECSFRALEFATEFAQRQDATVRVIHVTDHRTEATDDLIQRAQSFLSQKGLEDTVDVYYNVRTFRRADSIGKDILEIIEEEDIDHVVMGHHGTGAIGRMILGSAAKTVVQSASVPVTVIP